MRRTTQRLHRPRHTTVVAHTDLPSHRRKHQLSVVRRKHKVRSRRRLVHQRPRRPAIRTPVDPVPLIQELTVPGRDQHYIRIRRRSRHVVNMRSKKSASDLGRRCPLIRLRPRQLAPALATVIGSPHTRIAARVQPAAIRANRQRRHPPGSGVPGVVGKCVAGRSDSRDS